jgi:H+/Cl- antiporter ClcA
VAATPDPRPGPARLLAAWTGLGALCGVACGASSALFLALLDRATALRASTSALVYALPLAGLVLGAILERWGQAVRGGHNLVLDTAHGAAAAPPLPFRMAPLVLVGTVVTHLFGGSAGREGTAVQMGASLSDAIARAFRAPPALRRDLIVAGIAGGFGAVFGTPIAGVVFALEVLAVGRLALRPLVPAVVAAFVGDAVTRALGIIHTPYPVAPPLPLDAPVVLRLLVMGVAMAAAAVAFVALTRALRLRLERWLPRLPLRLCAGGAALVLLWHLAGTPDYLGLGIPTIERAFSDPSLPASAFAWKILFTAVTIGAGFVGGEVTPLFFVGATLGSVLARALGLPIELGAGVGLAAVFGAAANAPIALTLMAAELLGPAILPHVAIVTAVAYLLTGPRGIYPAQRLSHTKLGVRLVEPTTLRDLSRK